MQKKGAGTVAAKIWFSGQSGAPRMGPRGCGGMRGPSRGGGRRGGRGGESWDGAEGVGNWGRVVHRRPSSALGAEPGGGGREVRWIPAEHFGRGVLGCGVGGSHQTAQAAPGLPQLQGRRDGGGVAWAGVGGGGAGAPGHARAIGFSTAGGEGLSWGTPPLPAGAEHEERKTNPTGGE